MLKLYTNQIYSKLKTLIVGDPNLLRESYLELTKSIIDVKSSISSCHIDSFINNPPSLLGLNNFIFLESKTHILTKGIYELLNNYGIKILLIIDSLHKMKSDQKWHKNISVIIQSSDSIESFREGLNTLLNTDKNFYSSSVLTHILSQGDGQITLKNNVNISKKETQVIQQFWNEKSKWDVAESMNISIRTVEAYRSRLISKLNKDSFIGVIKYAVETGLVN